MSSKILRQVPAQKFGDQFKALRAEILERLEQVCLGGQFILGEEVRTFERDFAKWLGAAQAVGCNSGTDALLLALMALGVGAGDEVITTPSTFFATGNAIARTGAKPVFADIDPASYTIDPRQMEKRITAKTKALLPVHLFGQPCGMDEIINLAAKHRLTVIEDCAQAHGTTFNGRKVGTFGHFGCFSFYPTKNLGAYGDGGMMVTGDEALAQEVRTLRVLGARKKYDHEKVGMNSRLDEMQAAILNVKLKHLDEWLRARRERAHRYNRLFQEKGLSGVQTPFEDPRGFHTFHLYVVRVPRRDALFAHLAEAGIQAGIYYPHPIHLDKAFAHLGHKPGDFPEAERASRETLSLPLYPELTDEDQNYVVAKIAEFL